MDLDRITGSPRWCPAVIVRYKDASCFIISSIFHLKPTLVTLVKHVPTSKEMSGPLVWIDKNSVTNHLWRVQHPFIPWLERERVSITLRLQFACQKCSSGAFFPAPAVQSDGKGNRRGSKTAAAILFSLPELRCQLQFYEQPTKDQVISLM